MWFAGVGGKWTVVSGRKNLLRGLIHWISVYRRGHGGEEKFSMMVKARNSESGLT